MRREAVRGERGARQKGIAVILSEAKAGHEVAGRDRLHADARTSPESSNSSSTRVSEKSLMPAAS
jgi:hypothetical protein